MNRPLYNNRPCIKTTLFTVSEILSTLLSAKTDESVEQWMHIFHRENDNEYMNENEKMDVLIDTIIKHLRGYIRSCINTPVSIELLSYLDHGRFSHEQIADRFYMDSPLFPEDEEGDYASVRNIIDVTSILIFQTAYVWHLRDSKDEFGNRLVELYGRLNTNYTIPECVERLKHRSLELFMFYVKDAIWTHDKDLEYFLVWNDYYK